MTKSKNKYAPRVQWTPEQVAMLYARYPHESSVVLANEMGIKLHRIYAKVNKLGISKTEAYLNSPAAGRLTGGQGYSYRYPKGHVPANKGKKGINYPGMKPTQFKPGEKSKNWMPVGSERVNSEGILQLKISDTGYPPVDWVGMHVLVWQATQGALLKTHVLRFKDGNKSNVTLENLECITQKENMRRNSIHTILPKELAQLAQLRGAINRKINRRQKSERITKTTE
jgi:HNH endonuclease